MESPHWIEYFFKLTTSLAIIIGGIWGYYEYQESNRKEAIRRTLAHIESFKKPSFADAIRAINQSWDSFEAQNKILRRQMREARIRANAEYYDKVSKLWHRVVVGRVIRPVESDVRTVIDAANDLAICVNNGLCDSDTSRAYFGLQARRLVDLHCPYILFVRHNMNGQYAEELEKFTNIECADRLEVVQDNLPESEQKPLKMPEMLF